MTDETTNIKRFVPIQDNSTATINKALEELLAQTIIIKETKETIREKEGAPTNVSEMILPTKPTGLAVTDETLYIDPTTGITLASVKVEWNNNPELERVDIYEILRF